MAEIEIEKQEPVQIGRPGAVHIRLIGDNGDTKAMISVYPKFEKPPFTDTFKVEIHKVGDSLIAPDLDMRFLI